MPRIPRNRNRLSAELAERKEAADKASRTAAKRRVKAKARNTERARTKRAISESIAVLHRVMQFGYDPAERAAIELQQQRQAEREARERILEKDRRGNKPGPTIERIAKPDVQTYKPRELYGAEQNRDLKPEYEVRQRRRDDPIAALSHVLSADEMAAGYRFGRAYEKTQRTGGAINLNGNGGGPSRGLTHAMCEAMGAFGAMCRVLSEDEEERLRRSTLMIRVCGERRTLSDLFPSKGRTLATAKHVVISCLQRLDVAMRSGAIS